MWHNLVQILIITPLELKVLPMAMADATLYNFSLVNGITKVVSIHQLNFTDMDFKTFSLNCITFAKYVPTSQRHLKKVQHVPPSSFATCVIFPYFFLKEKIVFSLFLSSTILKFSLKPQFPFSIHLVLDQILIPSTFTSLIDFTFSPSHTLPITSKHHTF